MNPLKEVIMEHIWAPWRMAYIEGKKSGGCVLCEKAESTSDEENLVLCRDKYNFVMLNLYPYNPYHLMVVPYRHISAIEVMTEAERNEHFTIVSRCVEILRKELTPAGFNVGINMGSVAGAGIEDHIHTHIIPRWQGDTNFITVVSDIRVIPEALADSYRKLKDKF